jgi:hypothetical protein
MEKRQRTAAKDNGDGTALERVKQVQDQLEEINDEAATAVLQIQSSANAKRAPVYESRKTAIASVPGFWKRALMGHPWLADIITDQCARPARSCIGCRPGVSDEVGVVCFLRWQGRVHPFVPN